MKAQFDANDVLGLCKRYVYPPCKKLGGHITLQDRLAADLGYVGSSASLLALRTNEAFQMDPSDGFSSMDLVNVETVQDHVVEVCRKLARKGRLLTKETRTVSGLRTE
jgi:hypothetical protein